MLPVPVAGEAAAGRACAASPCAATIARPRGTVAGCAGAPPPAVHAADAEWLHQQQSNAPHDGSDDGRVHGGQLHGVQQT